jgi:hypothetical protein
MRPVPLPELRYIIRDGQKVLQQLHYTVTFDSEALKWIDVPTAASPKPAGRLRSGGEDRVERVKHGDDNPGEAAETSDAVDHRDESAELAAAVFLLFGVGHDVPLVDAKCIHLRV